MSEHETSLNPFHVFDNDDPQDDIRSSSVFTGTGADSNRKFNHLEKKRLGGNSHRMDHTNHEIEDEDDRLAAVREEV